LQELKKQLSESLGLLHLANSCGPGVHSFSPEDQMTDEGERVGAGLGFIVGAQPVKLKDIIDN
jgi:hypothetical protein